MKRVIILLLAVLASSAFAQTDLADRVVALEQEVARLQARISQLEQMLAIPAAPPTTVQVEEFTFTRLNARQTSIGLELVGEVIATVAYSRVEFRVTYYGEDGSILETDTFYVEEVGTAPRTFDTGMFTDYSIDDVASIGLQVEGKR
jgi:hypothetical protein